MPFIIGIPNIASYLQANLDNFLHCLPMSTRGVQEFEWRARITKD